VRQPVNNGTGAHRLKRAVRVLRDPRTVGPRVVVVNVNVCLPTAKRLNATVSENERRRLTAIWRPSSLTAVMTLTARAP